MCVNEREALLIHDALHEKSSSGVRVAGTNWPITTTKKDLREVKINSTTFIVHDTSKPSRWTTKVKKGGKITWIIPAKDSLNKGRIVDGVIEVSCISLDNSLRQDEDTEEPAKKKQKKEETDTSDADRNLTETEDFSKSSNEPETPAPQSRTSSFLTTSDPLLVWQIDYSDLTVGAQLGAGAFGSVMKGIYRSTDVAIKVLHSQDNKAQEMFRKEAELMCKIRHPYIVQCLGACITPPNCCIVMELLPSNLSKLLKEVTEDIEFRIFHRIILGIATGLAFLHLSSPPIIHRDMKPGNILLDTTFNPRIADFGVSREKSNTNMTMTRIGTPTYCAPEVLNGEYYSTKVDIYSFGMLIYAMAIRGTPWKNSGLGPVQVMMKVAKQERPAIPTNIRADIQALITTCWQHNPNSRPESSQCVEIIKSMKESDPTPPPSLASTCESTQLISTATIQFNSPASTTITTTNNTSYSDPTLVLTTAIPHKKDKKQQPTILDDESVSSLTASTGAKSVCRYDQTCFRKNPQHFEEYSHPQRDQYMAKENAYREFLRVRLQSNTVSIADRKELNNFRTAKQLTIASHEKILAELGWTKEEFDSGERSVPNNKRKRGSK